MPITPLSEDAPLPWHASVPRPPQFARRVIGAAVAVALCVTALTLEFGGFAGVLVLVALMAVAKLASDLRRVEVLAGGVVLRSMLGFRLRAIPFTHIQDAGVVQAVLDDPDETLVARRDRFVTRDGSAMELLLTSGARVVVSTDGAADAAARIHAALDLDATPPLTPGRASWLLPRIAVDQRSFERRFAVVALWLPLGIVAAGALVCGVGEAPRSFERAIVDVVLLGILAAVLAAFGGLLRFHAGDPERVSARSSAPAWPLIALTLGGAAAILLAPAALLLSTLLLTAELASRDLSPTATTWSTAMLLTPPVVLAVLTWRILRRRPQTEVPEQAPQPTEITLLATERVIWTGRFQYTPPLVAVWAFISLAGLGLGALLLSVGDALVGTLLTATIVAAPLISLPTRLRIDRAGVRITGLLGLPLRTVPLHQIQRITVDRVALMESDLDMWSSWQRRFVTRPGPALLITRTDRKRITATVDNPADAAGTLLAFTNPAAAPSR